MVGGGEKKKSIVSDRRNAKVLWEKCPGCTACRGRNGCKTAVVECVLTMEEVKM